MKSRLLRIVRAALVSFAMISIMTSQALAFSQYQPSGWSAPKMEIAEREGLISGSFDAQPFTDGITRMDFCRLLISSCQIFDLELPKVPAAHPFTDTQEIIAEQAYSLGLIQGTADGRFDGDLPLTREMAACILDRLRILFQPGSGTMDAAQAARVLREHARDGSQVSGWARRDLAEVYTRGLLSGNGDGVLNPQGLITREQAVILNLNLLAYCGSPEIKAAGVEPAAVHLPNIREQAVYSARSQERYSSAAAAERNMVTIRIQVWQLSGGKKITADIPLTVHKNVAESVAGIFDEIYNGEEKFPIKSVGGYSYRNGNSQHSNGTAIDINPNENYFVGRDGAIKAGQFWLPGENPYSIPPDGDVVRAFKKYGWHWSPDMHWSNGSDYMHFSVTGT